MGVVCDLQITLISSEKEFVIVGLKVGFSYLIIYFLSNKKLQKNT